MRGAVQPRFSLQSSAGHCGWVKSNPYGLFLTRFLVFFVIPFYQRSGSGIDERGRKARAAPSKSSVLRLTLNRETGVNHFA